MSGTARTRGIVASHTKLEALARAVAWLRRWVKRCLRHIFMGLPTLHIRIFGPPVRTVSPGKVKRDINQSMAD
jgi:hypothetical protein